MNRRCLAVLGALFFALLAIAASALFIQPSEEEARVGAAAAIAGQAVAALYADQDPPTQIWLMRPICPDQWISQRSAGERWRTRCVKASTEGSRVTE